jgi:hypothetical protein
MDDPSRVADFDRRVAHLPVLEFTREAAVRAGDLWRLLRTRKRTVVMRDLFLTALADAHRVRLLTADSDFMPLQELGLDIAIVREDSRVPLSPAPWPRPSYAAVHPATVYGRLPPAIRRRCRCVT